MYVIAVVQIEQMRMHKNTQNANNPLEFFGTINSTKAKPLHKYLQDRDRICLWTGFSAPSREPIVLLP